MNTLTKSNVRLFASAKSWIEGEALRQLYAISKLEGMRLAVHSALCILHSAFKMVVPAGNAPASPGYQPGALLLSYRTESESRGARGGHLSIVWI